MKTFDQKSAMIFDDEEPIGQPTDLVLPRRRWFGRGKADGANFISTQPQTIKRT